MTDEEGEILWSWESKPFGESAPNEDADNDDVTFALNLRFPGQYYDSESNLSYNINRYYNPTLGRYMQSDPIGLEGGSNTFLYVHGSPLCKSDPDGKGKVGIAIKFTKKAWNHIFERHVIGEGSLFVFKDSKATAKYLKEVVGSPNKITKQSNGRILLEKRFKHSVGRSGEKIMRVVVDPKTGEIITAHPAKSYMVTVWGSDIGTTLFGEGLLADIIDFVNPLSDIRDIANLLF